MLHILEGSIYINYRDSGQLFPTTQVTTLNMDIIKRLIPKSDLFYSLQPKMEKLYMVKKKRPGLTVVQIMNSLLQNSNLN